MGTRLELHTKLKTLTPNVYFQPPESVKMVYPCIRYELTDILKVYADNKSYAKQRRYQITYIDANPDNTIVDTLVEWPLCRFDRSYVGDNLNHYVFDLYY